MTGNVAIVTGAGSGIGRACARELDRSGHRLVLLGRRATALQETASLLGAPALVFAVDVTDADAVADVVRQVDAKLGGVDVLVNCAGQAPRLAIEQTTPQQWRQLIESNLSSAFYCCRAVWAILRRRGGGCVVNISSEAARDPFDGFLAYGSAKAGLNLFTKALAREGAGIGVRVYAIAPAAVETAMFRALVPHDAWPTEKTLAAEDVAAVVGQCVSGALRSASGETIFVHKTV